MAGAGGFEPPNAGTKNRCLRPLGYAPSEDAGNIRLLDGARKYHSDDFRAAYLSAISRAAVTMALNHNLAETFTFPWLDCPYA